MTQLLRKLRAEKLLAFTLLVFTLAVGIVLGTLINVNMGVKAARDNPSAPNATPLVIPSPVEMSNTFSQIAKQVEPSVVNISTTYSPKPGRAARRRPAPQPDDEDQDNDNGGMNEFLYRFFGGPGGSPEGPSRRGYAL